MILSGDEIKKALREKKITIVPLPDETKYSSTAVDLLLSDEFREFKTEEELKTDLGISASKAALWKLICIAPNKLQTKDEFMAIMRKYTKPMQKQQDGSFILPPNKFALCSTQEFITLPIRSKIAARVEGRSTLARLGLLVHLTAPTIHCGFRGTITLELYNVGQYPLCLYPNQDHICQLIFERVGRMPQHNIESKFGNQKGLTLAA